MKRKDKTLDPSSPGVNQLRSWKVFFRSVENPKLTWNPVTVEAANVVDAAVLARMRCELDGGYRVVQIRENE